MLSRMSAAIRSLPRPVSWLFLVDFGSCAVLLLLVYRKRQKHDLFLGSQENIVLLRKKIFVIPHFKFYQEKASYPLKEKS